jgi:uncharacterized membrane protein YphA (DoxX/SURF4 family)
MNFFRNIAVVGGLVQIIAFGAGSLRLDAGVLSVITAAF